MTGVVKVFEPIRNIYTVECQDGKPRYYPSELLEVLELQPEVAVVEMVEAEVSTAATVEAIAPQPGLERHGNYWAYPDNLLTPRKKIKIQGISDWQPPQPAWSDSDITSSTSKASDIAVSVYAQLVEETQPITGDITDDSWIVSFLKNVAQNDKFESLKELAQEPEFPLDKLKKLSTKIVEKDGSLQPYKRLKLMLDALSGIVSDWVTNPYLQMV
jgi:hypothetical protein